MRDTDMMQEQSRSYSDTRENEHKLVMNGRKHVELTGVTEVISFDSDEVCLETTQGTLRFCGEELHVKRLTLERGEVTLEGHIREIAYYESAQNKTAGNIIRRLFR
jgi:sporulation protein YabP